MTAPASSRLSRIDRLRIEALVWALDQRLYDLPRRSRIAYRREVRQNLLNAAADLGTRSAVRRLGSSRELAAEYRAAEFGARPRPAYYSAAIFLMTGQLVFTAVLSEAASAFAAGITAANPHASGTFAWHGISFLQSRVTYTFSDGHGDWVGGAWTPLAWALWAAATIAIGRLWRVFGIHRRSAVGD
jgi:hypothetical protein